MFVSTARPLSSNGIDVVDCQLSHMTKDRKYFSNKLVEIVHEIFGVTLNKDVSDTTFLMCYPCIHRHECEVRCECGHSDCYACGSIGRSHCFVCFYCQRRYYFVGGLDIAMHDKTKKWCCSIESISPFQDSTHELFIAFVTAVYCYDMPRIFNLGQCVLFGYAPTTVFAIFSQCTLEIASISPSRQNLFAHFPFLPNNFICTSNVTLIRESFSHPILDTLAHMQSLRPLFCDHSILNEQEVDAILFSLLQCGESCCRRLNQGACLKCNLPLCEYHLFFKDDCPGMCARCSFTYHQSGFDVCTELKFFQCIESGEIRVQCLIPREYAALPNNHDCYDFLDWIVSCPDFSDKFTDPTFSINLLTAQISRLRLPKEEYHHAFLNMLRSRFELAPLNRYEWKVCLSFTLYAFVYHMVSC